MSEPLSYNKCKSNKSISNLEEYINNYPDGEHLPHVTGWLKSVLPACILQENDVLKRIAECNEYLRRYEANSRTCSSPTLAVFWGELVEMLKDLLQRSHDEYVNRLLASKGTMTAIEYAKLFNEELLTEDDYVKIGLTRDNVSQLKKIKEVRRISIDQLDRDKFENGEYNLPSGCTELYFWGMPASGKTCCLSAVLSTATQKRYTRGYKEVLTGNRYFEELTNVFQRGKDKNSAPLSVLVTRTYEGSIASAVLQLGHPKYKRRVVCLIDLPGETFKSMHDSRNKVTLGDTEQLDLDVATSYLTSSANKNRKLHFFIIPYTEPGTEKLYNGITSSQYLQAAALYLKDHEIIKKSTDGIYVIVTKVDKMNCDESQYKTMAVDYVNTSYGSFIEQMEEICRDNGIGSGKRRVEILPFTIGELISPEVCKFDEKGALELIDLICMKSKMEPTKFQRFLNKIFGA